MAEEAPVFRRKHRLDQMIRQFVDRDGVFVDDAAMADFIAVAVKEGDGEIALRPPVALGFLEGRKSECQHQHRAGRAQGHALAEDFEDRLLPAGDAEATEENRDIFPPLRELEPGVPDRRIDPGIDSQKDVPFLRPVIVFPRFPHGLNHLKALRHHAGAM
ncbi:hypothetical protein D3C87_1542490 [compost metagenome]